MKLTQEIEKNGQWLFRHRSYLPLIVLAGAAPAFCHFSYPFGQHALQEWWEVICLGVSLTGLLVRAHAVGHAPRGTSGRHRRAQVASTLNATGLYSIVRHPLYLGNYLTWLGVAAVPRSLSLVCIVSLIFWLYHERIICAEEAFLESKFDNAFREWAARVPTFIPNPALWVKPARPFSLRKVIRQEYLGLFALTTVFTILEIVGDSVVHGWLHWETPWLIAWAAAFGAFVTIRLVIKFTPLLKLEPAPPRTP